MTTKPLLSIHNLQMRFNKTVVDIDQLNLFPGETLALVGESGCGKSLTARAIMQLLPTNCEVAAAASILYADRDLLTLSEAELCRIRGKHIGLIFQEALSALNPVQTIGQQIAESVQPRIRARKALKKRVLQLLQEVHMPNPERVYHSFPHQLSGGMNQRAVIAIALANKPRILIADEPTTALDASVQTKIMQLLKTLCKTHRMSMLFITHNLALASDYADRIAVMQDGRIVENNDSAPFFDAPKHAYSRQLIAANKPTPSHGVNTVDHSQPILQCKHLNKGYYQTQSLFKRLCTFQVNDISFTLHRGETVALVGESGSGKTTIARIFMQLETPESGSLAIGRQQLPYGTQRSLQITQNNVQMIFQNPDTAMNPKWQIADILAEGIQTRKPFYDDEQITQLIDTLLDQVGLDKAIKNRYPHELSGGQKQRICIARALSMQPKVIICDEPTSALDVSSQQAIIELLQRLQQHHQYAYLLITHDLSVVSSLAHRVVVMQNGQIVESGSVQGVLTQPNTLYTQKLLNALPAMQRDAISACHTIHSASTYESA